MDVRTPGEADRSLASAAATLAAALAVSGLLVVPALRWPDYARWLATLLAALLAGLAVRPLGSALAATVPREPPELDGDRPTVTVLLTAYNEVDALPATLDACRSLDYPDEKLEILVCYEAASTDGTAAVAERAARADAQVRAVERDRPPGGKAAAVNFALDRARGDLVASLDADQRPESDAVRRAVRWFADEDVWVVKGRCFGTNPGESLLALHATVERHLAERAEFVARDRLDAFTLFTGGQAVFRADALAALGGFDESVLLEDVEMACRVHAAGGTARVDPEVVTREDNPATLRAWWSQRERWARGGMQVARRYLSTLPRNDALSLAARLDAVYTFGYLLAVPLLALAAPVFALAKPVGGLFGPLTSVLAGVLAVAVVFALDHRDGRSHARREYLAALTLPAYAAVQSAVVVSAFLAEFVLRRPAVYVTSTRADE